MFRLTVKTGADERELSVEQGEILFGRREGVDVVVSDRAASRNHCVLREEGGRALLLDLGTVNGTCVGGERVEQALLRVGDEFAIGATIYRLDSIGTYPGRLQLEDDDPPAVAAAAPAAAAATRAPVPTGAEPDFAYEVRRILRQTPWYTISLAVHIVALLILDLIAVAKPEPPSPAMIAAIDRPDDKLPEVEQSDPVPDLDDLDMGMPEEPELAESDFAGEESDLAARAEEDSAEAEREILRMVGPGRQLATRIRPLTVPPSVGKDAGTSIDTGDLRGAQGDAKKVVERGMSGALRSLRTLPRDKILVMQGEFDEAEALLRLYDIPYTPVRKKDLLRRRYPAARLLLLNCDRPPPEAIRGKLVARVRNFVQRGGWLASTDWCLDPYVVDAFPTMVRSERTRNNMRQRDTTVPVEPAQRSPLLRGVFHKHVRSDWWLEEASKFPGIVNRARVNVLVQSRAMEQRFGPSVVALEFTHGKGRVLHMVGHFYQKKGNKTGLIAMHRLFLNFVGERFPE